MRMISAAFTIPMAKLLKDEVEKCFLEKAEVWERYKMSINFVNEPKTKEKDSFLSVGVGSSRQKNFMADIFNGTKRSGEAHSTSMSSGEKETFQSKHHNLR